jgi:hypothetical protein
MRMAGKPTGSNRVMIAVAVIGAVGTIGAAIVTLTKPKDQTTPSVQQISSGAGAINAGRDAIVTNNLKSPSEEAAERVQACEERHGMKQAVEKAESNETIPASTGADEEIVLHIDFRSCSWPAASFADGDGFLQIRVRDVRGPGEYEATGITEADRFTAPCSHLLVSYGFGHMGEFSSEKPFRIDADTVIVRETQETWKNDGHLPFYPDRGEFVVLHNSHYSLQSAACTE